MSPWNWSPERNHGIWRHGAPWLRPAVAVAPWVTILLLFAMLYVASRAFVAAPGVLFDLPEADFAAAEATDLVALVMPMSHDTLVFFDDARYRLGDETSVESFASHLAERMSASDRKTLLILADRRIAGGELMRLAGVARRGGATRVLFAERKTENAE